MSEEEATNDPPTKFIVIIIRPALKLACCEGDPCRAAIYNQLLYSLMRSSKHGRNFWYGSAEQICSNLLDDSWGICKVRQEIKSLVSQGFIKQRRNPKAGWDRTFQYMFEAEQAQKFKDACDKAQVCVLHHMGFTTDVLKFLRKVDAINECHCSEQVSHEDEQAYDKQPHQEKKKQSGPRLRDFQTMPYAEYLQTSDWATRRAKALRFAGYRCQICNSPEELNVHHRTYERLGHEHMGDLITLCKNCHEIFHNNAELSGMEG